MTMQYDMKILYMQLLSKEIRLMFLVKQKSKAYLNNFDPFIDTQIR